MVSAWFEMCRTGDVERVADLVTSDYVAHGPGGSSTAVEFKDWLRWYPTTFGDQQPVLEDVVESDRVVVRYTIRSTYRGGFLDLPARGQPVCGTGIIPFRLASGKVAETWFVGNDLEVAQQLGARVSTTGPTPPGPLADTGPA